MVYEIVWTSRCLSSYVENIEYLMLEWTAQEIEVFKELVDKKLDILETNPEIGISKSKKEPNLRSTVVHKRINLIYRIYPRKKQVQLLLFWNTYRNPSKVKGNL